MMQHTDKQRMFVLLCLLLAIVLNCKPKNESKFETLSTSALGIQKDKSLHLFGMWTVSERKKLGGWNQKEEYFYSQEEFENRFDTLLLEIEKQNVKFTSPHLCYGTNKIIKDTLFRISGVEQGLLDKFLENELMVDPTSYIGYISIKCEYPLNTLYIFKDKILVQEYGAYFYILTKTVNHSDTKSGVSKSENIIKNPCKSIYGPMFSGEECLLSSLTIEDSYKDILEEKLVENVHFLHLDLPKKNETLEINDFESGLLSIVYKRKNQIIEIDMEYVGGVTSITLEQRGNDVLRKIIYYAD